MPGMPEKLIAPVTVEPVWVSCHVIALMPVCPITLPWPIELLESEGLPTHVPAADIAAAGEDGEVGDAPPQAATTDVKRTATSSFFMSATFPPARVRGARLDTQILSRSGGAGLQACSAPSWQGSSPAPPAAQVIDSSTPWL